MSRGQILFTYSALIGFLGAITFLLSREFSYAKAQDQRAVEDAAIRHQFESAQQDHV